MPQPVIAPPSLLPAATHPALALFPRITDDLNLPAPPLVNLKPADYSLRTSYAGADRSGNAHKKY